MCHSILGSEIIPYEEGMDDSTTVKNDFHKPGDDYLGFQPQALRSSSLIKPTLFKHLDLNPTTTIPLSAKMKGTVDQVMAWQKEAPSDKILSKSRRLHFGLSFEGFATVYSFADHLPVFTQFVDSNRLLGRALGQRNIKFLYLVGGMSEKRRAAAKNAFADIPDVKVMVSRIFIAAVTVNKAVPN